MQSPQVAHIQYELPEEIASVGDKSSPQEVSPGIQGCVLFRGLPNKIGNCFMIRNLQLNKETHRLGRSCTVTVKD